MVKGLFYSSLCCFSELPEHSLDLYEFYGWIRKKKKGHICKNLTKNGEPQRYSWERRRRRSVN